MEFSDPLFLEIIALLKKHISEFQEIYLVGGSIRDFMLGKTSYDLDFVLPRQSIKAAKLIADEFNSDFYVLDKKRSTARAIIQSGKTKKCIDFARYNGGSIFEDLTHRDFTFNAMALNIIKPDELLDPLYGKEHLQQKLLFPCARDSFLNDPVRVIRAVRFLGALNLQLGEGVSDLITQAACTLPQVSTERVRDELFRILAQTKVSDSFHRMIQLKIFDQIFLELAELAGIYFGKSHFYDALEHSINTAAILQELIEHLLNPGSPSSNDFINQILNEYKHLRVPLKKYLQEPLIQGRGKKELMIIGALFLDSGRLQFNHIEIKRRKENPATIEKSTKIARDWGKRMALSNSEIEFISQAITHHSNNRFEAIFDDADQHVSIYQYFKSAGNAGIAACFIYLADKIAILGSEIKHEVLKRSIESIKLFLESWFLRRDEVINPPKIINGDDLIKNLRIESGVRLGELLEEIRIAQVMGKIRSKQQALDYARRLKEG